MDGGKGKGLALAILAGKPKPADEEDDGAGDYKEGLKLALQDFKAALDGEDWDAAVESFHHACALCDED